MRSPHWKAPKMAVALPLRYAAAGMVSLGLLDLVFLNIVEDTGATAFGAAMGAWWVLEWTALGAAVGYLGFALRGQTPAWHRLPGPKWLPRALTWAIFGAVCWCIGDVVRGFFSSPLMVPYDSLIPGKPALSYVVALTVLGGLAAGGHLVWGYVAARRSRWIG